MNKVDVIKVLAEDKTFENETKHKGDNDLDVKIKNILSTTDFQKLKREEKEKGFIESANDDFFSIGKKEQWKDILNNYQIKKIEKNFSTVMEKFNYELSS